MPSIIALRCFFFLSPTPYTNTRSCNLRQHTVHSYKRKHLDEYRNELNDIITPKCVDAVSQKADFHKGKTAEKKLLRLAPASGHEAYKEGKGRRLTQLNVRGLYPN